MPPVRFMVASILLSAALLLGCGPNEATVSGKVTLDGAPLSLTPGSSGTVTFTPVKQGPLAQGQLDATGNYSLSTGTDGGLPAGSYQVTVVATEVPPLDPNNRSYVPLPKRLTPEKYGNAQTSGLTAEVKPGKNTADFDLKSK